MEIDKETLETVGRVLEISQAVNLVGENEFLEGTTAYRIGRLGDRCKSISRRYQKENRKISKEAREKQVKLLAEMKLINTAEGNRTFSEQINDENVAAQDKISELEEQLLDVKLRIPNFKLSEFIAKHDIIKEAENKKINIKSGQSLVPVQFFTLMGDLIQDDKNTDA